jgi:hypothetical protein
MARTHRQTLVVLGLCLAAATAEFTLVLTGMDVVLTLGTVSFLTGLIGMMVEPGIRVREWALVGVAAPSGGSALIGAVTGEWGLLIVVWIAVVFVVPLTAGPAAIGAIVGQCLSHQDRMHRVRTLSFGVWQSVPGRRAMCEESRHE